MAENAKKDQAPAKPGDPDFKGPAVAATSDEEEEVVVKEAGRTYVKRARPGS